MAKEKCNVNDFMHDTPPEVNCECPVMEGPGLNSDGSLVKTMNGETIRKDAAQIGPGMKDGKPIPKAERKTIRKDSASKKKL